MAEEEESPKKKEASHEVKIEKIGGQVADDSNTDKGVPSAKGSMANDFARLRKQAAEEDGKTIGDGEEIIDGMSEKMARFKKELAGERKRLKEGDVEAKEGEEEVKEGEEEVKEGEEETNEGEVEEQGEE